MDFAKDWAFGSLAEGSEREISCGDIMGSTAANRLIRLLYFGVSCQGCRQVVQTIGINRTLAKNRSSCRLFLRIR